ncbi:MAG: hypothetical protein LBS75_06685 [Synergistaceae bacterium]|nr:hypothetical protein [Synergistaceae bacterium]
MFALALLAAGFVIAPAPAAAELLGTIEQPHEITQNKFTAFKAYVEDKANSDKTIHAVLIEDIDVDGWTNPIGRRANETICAYNGTFDGGNHKITLTNTALKHNSLFGLFMVVSNDAVIQNLSMDITGSPEGTFSPSSIFSIARDNYGTIKDVKVDCDITRGGWQRSHKRGRRQQLSYREDLARHG